MMMSITINDQQDIIKLYVHLGTILHEDKHLLPVDLDAKVVDQVGVVDRFEDPEFVSNIPDDQSVMRIYMIRIVIIIISSVLDDQNDDVDQVRVVDRLEDTQLVSNVPDDRNI